MSSASTALKGWSSSASVILAAKTIADNKFSQDGAFKILTIKRSAKSSFMPCTHVFPGGKLDQEDNSKKWLDLYSNFGFANDAFQKLVSNCNASQTLHNEHNRLLNQIAFRIAAIRETFEECGILICGKNKNYNYADHWAKFVSNAEIQEWRAKVIKDPLEFYKLCLKFELYPDIWCLNEWSNWATPAVEKSRFDTIFFLAAFLEVPPATIDSKEVQEVQWKTPSEYLHEFKNQTIILPPPQFYELSRLQNFSFIQQLLTFANTRAKLGTERFLPYRINSDEAIQTLLPGDEMYPDLDILLNGEAPSTKSISESKILHRLEFRSPYDVTIKIQNYTPKNHVVPLPPSKL